MNANELADELSFKYIAGDDSGAFSSKIITTLHQQQAEIEALKKDNKELHAIAQRMAMAESDARKSLQWFKDVQAISSGENTILTDEEINVVAILQDAEIVPVGHEIWKTGEEFNKYKRIVLATAKALRKAQENDSGL